MSDPLDVVYEALDKGDYKDAKKLCLRPKYAAWPITKCLLAYCHANLREYAEAMAIARSVILLCPTDEHTLATLAHTLKICRADNDLALAYENALAKLPTNQTFLKELFKCYIKLGEPKKMQLLGQRLYKANSNPQFVFWSVSSMLQQDDLPPAMLTVAEKMIQKVLNTDAPVKTRPGAEELEMYLDVLLRQAFIAPTTVPPVSGGSSNGSNDTRFTKVMAALQQFDDLIARPGGAPIKDDEQFLADNGNMVKMHPLNISMMRIRLLETAWGLLNTGIEVPIEVVAAGVGGVNGTDTQLLVSCLDQMIDELRKVLLGYPDQYDAHQRLIGCLLLRASWLSHGASGDIQLSTVVVEHQQTLRNVQSGKGYLRGPRLAEMLLLLSWAKEKANEKVKGASIRTSTMSTDAFVIDLDLPLPVGWLASSASSSSSTSSMTSSSAASGDASTVAMELSHLLIAYIDHFRSNQCCFSDVKPFVTLLAIGTGSAGVGGGEGGRDQPAMTQLRQAMQARCVETESTLAALIQEGISHQSNLTEQGQGPGKSTASQETTTATVSTTASHLRDRAINMLCRRSKLGQIQLFSDLLCGGASPGPDAASSRPSRPSDEESRPLIDLFHATKSMCSGGVGGEREVQPGDELLLLCSARHRQTHIQKIHSLGIHNATHPPLSVNDEIDELVRAARWAALLMTGSQASPYTYSFKLELLEPLRLLAAPEPALTAFNGLGTKYIQYDSMSYLIIPSLIEGGFLKDACRQHRAVCAFHAGAKRETLDMIGRCYFHANYAKAAELHRFIHLCQTSVQLVLSRAELPLLELTDSKHTLEDSQSYLRDYFNSVLVESQSYLINDCSDGDGIVQAGHDDAGVKSSSSVVAESSSAPQKSPGQGQGRSEKTSFGLLIELRQGGQDGQSRWCPLSDNLDYQLLVSAESTADQEDKAKGERQRQLGHRIRVNQEVLRLLHCALCGEESGAGSSSGSSVGGGGGGVTKAREHLIKLHELWLNGNGNRLTTLPPASSTSSSSSSSSRAKGEVYSFDWFAKAAAVVTPMDVTTTTITNSSGSNNKSSYLQWDQRIVSAMDPGNYEYQRQGLGQGPYEDALQQAVISTLAYTLTQMSSSSSPAILDMAKSYREDMGCVKQWLLSDSSTSSSTSTQTNGGWPLRCYLGKKSGNNSNSDTVATSSSSSSLLSPRWITAVSAFTCTLATWGSLMLCRAKAHGGDVHVLVVDLCEVIEGVITVLNDNSTLSVSPGTADRSTSQSSSSITLKTSTATVATSTTTTATVSATTTTVPAISGEGIVALLQTWGVGSTNVNRSGSALTKSSSGGINSVVEAGVGEGYDGLTALAQQLASSRAKSCTNLRNILQHKLECLKELL